MLRSPEEPCSLLMKRIVALPGDFVVARKGRRDLVQVPAGHLWVEGDNKDNSNDSNNFGPVAAGLLEGVPITSMLSRGSQ